MLLLRFTPNINIFRDPRWGRGQETPGEDPYLTSEFAIAFVRGMQEGEDDRFLKTAADCKHYAGYDLENWHGYDRSSYNANISAQDLVETYLPSFEACVNDARVGSIMCSYKSDQTNAHPNRTSALLSQPSHQTIVTYSVACFAVGWCQFCQRCAVVCQSVLPANHTP